MPSAEQPGAWYRGHDRPVGDDKARVRLWRATRNAGVPEPRMCEQGAEMA